jgi:CheY-like chemotaxis protein
VRREFTRATLEQYGALVITALSAREAKAPFRRKRPDVFVSDLLMPDEDGLRLIRKIRQIERASGRITPAAALSALARTDDRRRALSAGYQMHMAKPIDSAELAAAIERLAQPPDTYARTG